MVVLEKTGFLSNRTRTSLSIFQCGGEQITRAYLLYSRFLPQRENLECSELLSD